MNNMRFFRVDDVDKTGREAIFKKMCSPLTVDAHLHFLTAWKHTKGDSLKSTNDRGLFAIVCDFSFQLLLSTLNQPSHYFQQQF